MNKILCIGEALIDMICTNNGSSIADGENFLKKPGGAPTNVAAAIAALGGQVQLAAKVGNDPFGKQLIAVMNGFGVDTKFMVEDNKNFTTMAFVSLMKNGERDFVFNRGADGQLSMDDLKGLNVNDYAIIHFGSATGFLDGPLKSTYLNILQQAKANNIFVSFDPNYRHLLFPNDTENFIAQSWNFLKQCDFFKLSDEEALLITKTKSLPEAIDMLHKNTEAMFAITIGSDGTLLSINKEVVTVDSIEVKAIDTTGAGDAFVGALLFQLAAKNKNEIVNLPLNIWKTIVFNANKAGARTCEHHGAMEAFKHLTHNIFN